MIYIYQIFVILLALDNAKRIKADKTIHHWLNGGLHLVAACVVWYLSDFANGLSLLCLTRVVFTAVKYNARGLGFDYVPVKPKSFVDKVEIFFFGRDGITPKIIYILILICLQLS